MSFTPSPEIESNQLDIYDKLEEVVTRHLHHTYQQPIAKHNEEAFLQAHQTWQMHNCPATILDSGCGTAESAHYLAQTYPDHLVIGIDQSEKRLAHSRNQHCPENCVLLRAECADFWSLAAQQHWQFEQHYLLYPNPWPKSQHFMRRWHGHPALQSLLAISKNIELRTNWKIYAQEFKLTLEIAKAFDVTLEQLQPEHPISAFETKYLASQHSLWQVKVII